MKSTFLLLTTATYCMMAMPGFSKGAADPSGTWRWEYEIQGETIKDSLQLNLEEGGKVVGTFQGTNNTAEIKQGKMEGDKLSLSVPIDFQGTDIVLSFSGTIKADDIDGTVVVDFNGETREFPWKPKRSVILDDVVGTWQIRIETPDGIVLEPTMTVSKDGDKHKAAYTSMQGHKLDVKDLRVEKNELLFTVTAEFDGNSLKVDYKGRPYGDKLKGTLAYDFAGNTGEGEFTAKRKKEEEKKDEAAAK